MPAYTFGPFILDASERRLLRDGQPVALTPKAFDLLCLLVDRSGHLVTKEELIQALWPDTFAEEANLNRYVSVLRKALGNGTVGGRYIETVPKRGYRFIAATVQPSTADPSAPLDTTNDVALPSTAVASASPGDEGVPATHGRRRLRLAALVAALTVAASTYATWLGEGPASRSTPQANPVHRQVTFAGREGSPALSFDGRRIAYVSVGGDVRRIVVQEIEGGRSVVIATAAEAGNLRWSPDGSELLYFARNNDAGGLFVVSSSGGVPRRIIGGLFVACWSPDGKRIAVARHLAGRVLLVDTAGHAETSIAVAGAQRWISDLDWSPATNRLLVAGNDVRGRSTIWTVRADGTDQQTAVAEQAEISAARWTARGDAVYYFRRDGQTTTLAKVSVAPARTSMPVVLLTGLEADGSFAVSADGVRLAYARAPFYSNLYAVDSPTPARRELTTRQLTYGTSLVERPSVSPDGTQVLFSVGHVGRANLYTIPIAGGEMTPVTSFDSFNVGGVWSPDGESIAFGSTEGGTSRVWLMRTGGGSPRPVSSGAFSDSFDVHWSSSDEILYQQAGNRNYLSISVATSGREQPLMADASVGWVFSPVHSPDRTKVVFGWSRQSASGLWVRNTHDMSQRLVYGPSIPTPIGWSADGQWIYAYEGRRAAYRGVATFLGETSSDVTILKLSAAGRATTVAILPFEEVGGITMTPDGTTFICSVYSSRSDVWIVEHFDDAEH